VIEIAGAILYPFPRTCRPAALVLACTMLGAIVAWLTVLGAPLFAIVPAILLVAVVAIALREPDPELTALRRVPASRRADRPPPTAR
jgi:hypothetical protein